MNRPKTPGEKRSANTPGELDSIGGSGPPREMVFAALALVWLVAFLFFFYSFELPNGKPLTRYDLWLALPEMLPPPPVNNGAPYGWQNLPQRFDLMLVAGIILGGAWGTGHLVVRGLRLPLEQRCAERTAFAFGAGLAALSLITLGFGLVGLLSRWLLGPLLVAAVVAELVLRRRDSVAAAEAISDAKRSRTATKPVESITERNPLKWICLATVAPFLLLMLLGSMLETTDFDVRAYHLVGPKEYFQAGRISFLEHNVYTSFPFLTEMLSLLAMVLRDDWYRGGLAGQLVLAGFAPLTAVALYAAGRRVLSPAAGWVAATVFLTTPWIYRISIIAYAEGGLTFYLLASVLGLIVFRDMSPPEQPARERSSTSIALLTGFLAGSGMACKYTGLVQVVAPIGIAIAALPLLMKPAPANRPRAFIGAVAFFSLGVALAIGPWLLKNVIETGNPVYPLGYSVFGGRDLDDAFNVKWNRVHGPRENRFAQLGYYIVDVIARNDWLSPLLYGFAALSLFVAARRRLVASLWLYAAYLFVAWWWLTHWIDRFWVPMIPVIALLAGIGAVWSKLPLWRWGAGLLAAVAIWFNLGYVTTSLCGYNAYLSDMDAAQRSVENPGLAYLNRTLPEGSKVLVVGDGEVFDARVPIVYNTVFDRSIFETWVSADDPNVPPEQRPLADAATIRKRLAEAGITHVYVNWQWILTYRSPGNYGFTSFISPHRFVELQKMGILGKQVVPTGNDPREWGVFFQEYGKVSADDRKLLESPDLTPGNSGRKWGDDLRQSINGVDALGIRQIFPVIR